MAFPYLDNPPTIPPSVLQELDALVTKLNAFLAKEHTATGGHSDITADSVTVADDGALTLGDLLLANPDGTTYLLLKLLTASMLQLGKVGTGGYGTWPGMRFDPAATGGGSSSRPWDVFSASVAAGPAWVIADPLALSRVLMLVLSSGVYSWRPEVQEGVDLGEATHPFGSAFVVTVSTRPKTVATLPAAPVEGMRASVTDATQALTAGIGAIVAGTGANHVPVYYDGTNWRIG